MQPPQQVSHHEGSNSPDTSPGDGSEAMPDTGAMPNMGAMADNVNSHEHGGAVMLSDYTRRTHHADREQVLLPPSERQAESDRPQESSHDNISSCGAAQIHDLSLTQLSDEHVLGSAIKIYNNNVQPLTFTKDSTRQEETAPAIARASISAYPSAIVFIADAPSGQGSVPPVDIGITDAGDREPVAPVLPPVSDEADVSVPVPPTDSTPAENSSPPPNTAPYPADVLDDDVLDVGELLHRDLSVFFSDDQGDTLTYSAVLADASLLPDWLTFDANSAVITGTPAPVDAAYLAIVVMATDGEFSATADYLVYVEDFDVTGTINDDVYNATAGSDSYNGKDGDDVIYGLGDHDLLFGEGGNDTIYGGNGRDTLYGNHGDDVLEGEGDHDRLFGGSGNDYLQGDSNNDTLLGGSGDDTLYGGNDRDYLTGGAGRDQFLFARLGDSEVPGQIDVISDYQQGEDLIVFANNAIRDTPISLGLIVISYDAVGDYTNIEFTDNNELIRVSGNVAFTDADFISISSIATTNGNDTITGTANSDYILGYDGDDVINTLNDDDIVFGGQGNDTIDIGNDSGIAYGQDGDDSITGAGELYGNDGNDTLTTNARKDYLDGGEGDDIINGRRNADTLIGGAGNDVFIFDQDNDDEHDIIMDMSSDDIVQLQDARFTFASADGAKNNVALTDDVDIFDVAVDFAGGSFTSGAGATFLYDTTDGELWYDSNGDVAGGNIRLIAVFDNFAAYSYDASHFTG